MRQSLLIHPDTPGLPGAAVEADAERIAGGLLKVRFTVTGPVEDLVIPPPSVAARRDELWRSTCLEAFVQVEGEVEYFEFNLSPSSDWAAYRFDGYRSGMAPVEPMMAPRITSRLTGGALELEATIAVSKAFEGRGLRLGLSAILETRDGTKSYWALAHPAGKPDFHHADCFAAVLEAPKAV